MKGAWAASPARASTWPVRRGPSSARKERLAAELAADISVRAPAAARVIDLKQFISHPTPASLQPSMA